MRDEEPPVLDAEYRVVGEDRWAPFKRWFWDHFDGWLPADWRTYTPREKFAHLFATAITTVVGALFLFAFLAVVVWWKTPRH